MDAIEIFHKLIGDKIEPLIVRYSPYSDTFITHPYRHTFDNDFEKKFSEILFDSIIFYAYEKDEIEKEFQKGRLSDLQNAARVAYENRVPKTEKEADGLMGELTLDAFIKLYHPNIELLYSRAKYIEKLPHKEASPERKGHEIKGYDGMVFSIEDEQKYFWVGQVKTGKWDYCLSEIKNDINKSIIKYYFADSIAILCDIMRATNSVSTELNKIIDDINDIIYNNISDREIKTQLILDYFKKEHIKIRIPCLLMPNEANYSDSSKLLELIKNKTHNAFSEFKVTGKDNLDIEILLIVFPLRNLEETRKLFLAVRKA